MDLFGSPEVIQITTWGFGTDKSASVYRWSEVAIAIAASA